MPTIGLVSSTDAPGELCTSDLSLCLLTIATMLKIDEQPLPRILFLHVSEAAAAEFGVTNPGVIRHNRCGAGEPSQYYEVWVIGQPQVSDYAIGLIGVLEDWFRLTFSDEERWMAAKMAQWATTAGIETDLVVH